MICGTLLVAHNNGKEDYLRMAEYTAERIHKFLDLPVSLISDTGTLGKKIPAIFDKIILVDPDKSNIRKNNPWINKGRYQLFDLSPYDDTLVLDTDYMVNSRQLLNCFTIPSDFSCHKNIRWLMEKIGAEWLCKYTIPSAWATVMRFKKTNRAKQIFDLIEMVQKNYEHYANIYNFQAQQFRNDYALTIAMNTVNGHIECQTDTFWWNLLHVGLSVKVERIGDASYKLISKDGKSGKQQYIIVRDLDFHMLNKLNFVEMT